MSGKEELKRRFGKKQGQGGVRRRDYLGDRVSILFRAPFDVQRKMKLLRALASTNVNELCVRTIEAALDAELGKIRKAMDEGEWEVIVRALDGGSPRDND